MIRPRPTAWALRGETAFHDGRDGPSGRRCAASARRRRRPPFRALLSRFLVGEGYRVSTAETALEARATLESLKFDLLILDVMMPARTLRPGARHPRRLDGADPHADRARREGEPDHGARNRRRRLSGKTVRARELSLRVANILKRLRRCACRRWNRYDSDRRIPRARANYVAATSDPPDRSRTRNAERADGEGRRDVPRQALAGNGDSVSERTVDVQVNRLRRKIEDDPGNR